MLRSILLLQVSQVLGRGLYILFSFYYINRYLGIEAKGLWASLFALFGILSAFSNLGFEVWLTREVAASTIDRRHALSFLFRAKGGLWLAALGLGSFWVVVDDYPPLMAAAFGLGLIAEGIALAEQAVFEGLGRIREIAFMSFIKSGGFTLLAVPFLILTPSLNLFAWVFAAALILRALFGWRAWRMLPEQVASPPRSWRPFLLMGSFTVVTIIYFKVDVLMLAFMLGRESAGNYDNAYLFVEGVMFISAAAGTLLYPRLVKADQAAKAILFDAMFKLILCLGLCGATAIALLGQPVGRLLIGPLFDGARQPLAVLGFALPIMFVNGLLNRWLFSEHRERFALICATAVAVFNVIGNYLAIPAYGAAGAAAITVLTEGLLLAIWLIWGRRSPRLLLWCLGGLGSLSGLTLIAHWLDGAWWVLALALLGYTLLLLQRLQVFRRLEV